MLTRRCGVLGDPIDHSLSPTLHRAGYAHLGLDWEYDAVRVPLGGLSDFVAGLDGSWRGLSVTMPLKQEAATVVDRPSERARLSGAVNTIVLGEEEVGGDNTDIPGAIAAIRERTGAPLERGVVLGAGATAVSLGLALADLGVRSIEVVARAPERAVESVERLLAHPGRPAVEVVRLDEVASVSADIVASTIPADAQTPRLVAAFAEVPAVFDAIYHPWPTPLAAGAAASDRVLVGGLDLLVHQAAIQFQAFTGQVAPLEVMRQAGERALAERGAP